MLGADRADFGLGDVLPDPRMVLKRGVGDACTNLASDDDWGMTSNAGEIAAVSALVGAFDFAAGGKDAALLVDLDPGRYTVVSANAMRPTGVALVEPCVVATADGGTGVALVEIYEVE